MRHRLMRPKSGMGMKASLEKAARRAWRWLAGPEGASSTEYALLLALVVVILIGTLTALGQALQDKLELIIEKIRASA